MNLLLDTHIAIWALNDDPALSEKARELILDADNTIYYSTVSVWEVMLKHNRHVLAVSGLKRKNGEPPHNDPFDRLLVAQAKVENLSFLTHDELIPGYEEKCVIPV